MSRILQKKVNKEPIRSPSPDIANRHIIQRTNSPINQAMAKLRQSKSSKYPLGRSFLNNQQYQAYIKSLEEKIRLLTEDNRTLYEQTLRQTKQVDFLKEMNLKHRKQLYKKGDTPRSNNELQYSPDILSEYESRIGLMSQEVKRIHELLASEKRKNEGLLEQINLLQRKNQDSNRDMEPAVKKELAEIEESLLRSFEKSLQNYQNKVDMVIRDQIKKVNDVEKNQRSILKILQNRKKYESPKSNQQLWKSNQYSTEHKSPFGSKYRIHQQSNEVQCLNCRLHLFKTTDLQSKIEQLNSRLKQRQTPINPSPSQLQSYLQKLQQIKMILTNQEVIDSINTIENNLSEIYSIDEKFEFMKSQKNSIIQELKEKEVQQMLQISALKKEMEVLKNEIKEQNEEIEKLKELLSVALKSPRKHQDGNYLPAKRSNIEGSILRKYIQQAVTRIDSLQNQLQKDLSQ